MEMQYLFRDEYNNKYGAEVDLDGELTSTERGQIHTALEDGKYFLPTQVGLPHLVVEAPEDLEDDWAPWHELVSLEIVEDELADPGSFTGDGDLPDSWFDETTAPELAHLLASFPSSSSQWLESTASDTVLADLAGDSAEDSNDLAGDESGEQPSGVPGPTKRVRDIRSVR